MGAGDEFGRAEIRQLDERRSTRPLRQEQVRRFEIADDDAVGMSFGDRFGCLEHIQYGFTDLQRAHAANVFFQVRSVDVLPNQVERSVRLISHVENTGDVLGSDLGQSSRLAPKPFDFRRGGLVWQEQPDDGALIERRVKRIDRQTMVSSQDRADAVLAGNNGARVDVVGRSHESSCLSE